MNYILHRSARDGSVSAILQTRPRSCAVASSPDTASIERFVGEITGGALPQHFQQNQHPSLTRFVKTFDIRHLREMFQ